MDEVIVNEVEQDVEEIEKTQEFDDKLMVEGLAQPVKGKTYQVPLYSKLYFFKNFELIGKLGIGNHVVDAWRKQVEDAEGSGDYFSLYKVDTKPTNVKTKRSEKMLTYYEKKYGVNFKFKVVYNYSFRITEAGLFLENVCQYNHEYAVESLFKYIEDEINDNFLSFIAKSLLEKDLCVLDFNSHILEFGEKFVSYCNSNILELTGISIMDFNFVHLDFKEDDTFLNIKSILYEKADMKMRKYTWKQQAKYNILEQEKSEIEVVSE